MGVSVVIYPLLATVFLLFLAFSPCPNAGRGQRAYSGRHLILKQAAPFDPLVAKLERRGIDGGERGRGAEWEYYGRNYKNVTEGGREKVEGETDDEDEEEEEEERNYLNITKRLIYLFPFIDVRPQDNMISMEELGRWNAIQGRERLLHRTRTEMQSRDVDRDGLITLKEYLPHFSHHEIESGKMDHGQAGWWNQQLLNADVDNDGALNLDEFNDFLHPEDSKNPRIQEWLQRENFRELDWDRDGKVSFVEFRERAYDIYRNKFEYESEEDYDNRGPDPELTFSNLDTNKDRFLSLKELEHIIHHLYPGVVSHSTYYTQYLMNEVDDNKDGSLSPEEMLDHPYAFYATLYDERNNFDEYDELHEEL